MFPRISLTIFKKYIGQKTYELQDILNYGANHLVAILHPMILSEEEEEEEVDEEEEDDFAIHII